MAKIKPTKRAKFIQALVVTDEPQLLLCATDNNTLIIALAVVDLRLGIPFLEPKFRTISY
jgi:hypothetical protein